MEHKTIASSCPWKIMSRGDWHCKALTGQPNGSRCDKSNCACLHIAGLLVNDLRVELIGIITELSEKGSVDWFRNKTRRDLAKGDDHENATSTTASARRDKS